MRHFTRSELRRAGDVSSLILREANNQWIDIPRSPKSELIFDREENRSSGVPVARALNPHRITFRSASVLLLQRENPAVPGLFALWRHDL